MTTPSTSPFNLSTLVLNKDAAKLTLFANGRNAIPLREHTKMLKVVGFVQNQMGISLQGNPRYEWVSTVKTELDMIRAYHNNYNRDNGYYSTAQTLSKMKWGRTLPANNLSLNIFHRPTRHAFCDGIYADKDMVNAHVSILCETFNGRDGVDISALNEYNKDPKYWRGIIAEHHGLDPVKSKDTVKQLFIRILFGGKYETWIKDFDIERNIKMNEQHPLVLKIESQLAPVRDAFYEANPQIVKDMKKHDPQKFSDNAQLKRSLLATALQTIERWLMEACVGFLVSEKRFDIADIVPCQDGLMILKSLDYVGIEQDFERVCSEQFGLNIKWVDKPFDEAIEIPDGVITKTYNDWLELLTHDGIAQDLKTTQGKRIQYRRPCEDIKDALYVFEEDKKRWRLEDPKNPITLLNMISAHYEVVKKRLDLDESLTTKESNALASRAMSLLKNCVGKKGICSALLCIADWCGVGFDTIPYYLGFENGYLDLRSHTFGEYNEDIFITTSTGYDFKFPDYTNQNDIDIREVLVNIFNGIFDDEKDTFYYLQIMASGLDANNYQHIWFFNGKGGNGKSMGLSLLESVLGNRMYKPANGELLASDSHKANQSSEELVALKGARCVAIAEMAKCEGMTWDALKLFTGGDAITARRLYSGLEIFKLSCSIICTFNGKKVNMVGDVSSDSRASLERRLRPVDFPFIFTDKEALLSSGDPKYRRGNRKYESELWRESVRHVYLDLLCGIYQASYSEELGRIIFNEPEKVSRACKEYLDNEDLFSEVFNESYVSCPCEDKPKNRIFLGDIYSDFTYSQQYKEGMNGSGRKTFSRTWNQKKFISWCEERFDVKKDFKAKKYIVGWTSIHNVRPEDLATEMEGTDGETVEEEEV